MQHVSSFAEAQQALRVWLDWYNRERPHQALGYRRPQEYRQQHEMNRRNPTVRRRDPPQRGGDVAGRSAAPPSSD